ncbi:MAG: hypothetical protein HY078_05425 [Elusimicrobia bacterium]|nr:hypothetical protein [Elusimicrobiota bacterium]
MPIPIPWPDSPPPTEVFISPDGTRGIWVRGHARDAFLYDRTTPPAFEPRWLDWDVVDVRWHMREDVLAEIELLRFFGDSSWFDADGNPNLPGETIPGPENPAMKRHDFATPLGKSQAFQSMQIEKVRWE